MSDPDDVSLLGRCVIVISVVTLVMFAAWATGKFENTSPPPQKAKCPHCEGGAR